MKWKLINESTGVEVKFPTTIDRENDKMTVTGGQPPRHGGSSGRIYTSDNREYYPNVAGLKWIDEDAVKCFIIDEQIDIDGHEFTDHMMIKAKTEAEARGKWREFYASYEGDTTKIDAGDYMIGLVDIKEIDESEYYILNKYI